MLAILMLCSGFVFSQNADPRGAPEPLRSGPSDAKVKLEVFFDLQCPACARFNLILKSTEAKYGNRMETTFRQFPLRIPAHDKAIMAARMVEAARLQGKGREMLDVIFLNQSKWSANSVAKTRLLGYARRLGLDMRQFISDYEDDETMRPIIDDIVRGEKLRVNSTPTVFLNGRELEYARALELESVISELLK